ncbi:MAG: hypothetical protein ACPG8W_00075 [Candidatus Promineifilaceae bacterium]
MTQKNTVLTIEHLKQTLSDMQGNGEPNLYRLASESKLLHWRVVEDLCTPNEYSDYQFAQTLVWILIWGINQFSTEQDHARVQEGQVVYTMMVLLYVYGEPRQALYHDPLPLAQKHGIEPEIIREIKYRSANQIKKMLRDAADWLLLLLQSVDSTHQTYSRKRQADLHRFVLAQRYAQLNESSKILARKLAILRKPISNAMPLYGPAWRELEQRCLIITSIAGVELWSPLANYLQSLQGLFHEHEWAARFVEDMGDSAETHTELLYHLQQTQQGTLLANKLLDNWKKWLMTLGPNKLQHAFQASFQLKLDEALKNRLHLNYAQLLHTHIDIDAAIEQYEALTWASGLVAASAHLQLAKAYRAKQNSSKMLNQFRYALAKLPTHEANTTSLRGQILAERAQYWIQEGRAFEQAQEDLSQVEKLMGEMDSAEFTYEFHRMRGTLAGNQNDFAATEHHFWQAWTAADKTANPRIKMHAQVNLGMSMLWHSRELSKNGTVHAEGGATMLMSALNRAQKINDLNVQKACLKSLADYAVFTNNYPVAINYYRQAIKIIKILSDEIWLVVVYVDLTEALCASGEIDTARETYQITKTLTKQGALLERLQTLQEQFPWLTLENVSLTSRQQKAYRYVLEQGRITRANYIKVTHCKARQASYDLTQLVADGWLEKHGEKGRGVHYTRKLPKQSYIR